MLDKKNPLTWPPGDPRTPVYQRKSNSPFQVEDDYKTERQLEDELRRFKATNIILSFSNSRGSGLQPSDSGVALYFDLPGKRQISICCDVYTKRGANLRALFKVIEAMRTIERYGGKHLSEKSFTGFAALPPPKDVWSILGVNKTTAESLSVKLRREYVMEAFRDRAKEGHSKGHDMAALTEARDQALKDLGLT